MPEGDTLHRVARALGAAMIGKRVDAFASPLPSLARAALEGTRIEAIEAHGKNLLICFDDGRALHTHLQMKGSWHLYRRGEPWQLRTSAARVTIEAEGVVAVCFLAPTVRLIRHRPRAAFGADASAPMVRDAVLTDERLRRLGPDILGEELDLVGVRARLRALGELPIGEAIMMQSALAGVGNIWKSESLFAARVDPFALVSELDDATLDRVVQEARRLMKASVARHATGGRARRLVYRRSGRSCLVCGATILMRRQGAAARSTYYCAACQRRA